MPRKCIQEKADNSNISSDRSCRGGAAKRVGIAVWGK